MHKYNIGQEVWFYQDAIINCYIVNSLEIQIDIKGIRILYTFLSRNGSVFCRREEDLYSSLDECKNSLIEKIQNAKVINHVQS